MLANHTACGGRATVPGRARLIPFFVTQLSTTIQVWTERSRRRRELGELADRNDHLLADIGLSVEEARHEAAKPFWAFSERRRGASAGAHGRQDAWPQVMNTPGGAAEHPAKSGPRQGFATTSGHCIKSTRSSNMRYLVALLFCRPRILNGTSPRLVESENVLGSVLAAGRNRIAVPPSPRTGTLALVGSLILLLAT